jgi:hypothetical protein
MRIATSTRRSPPYGWPADLSEEEALAQLLALNLDRVSRQP